MAFLPRFARCAGRRNMKLLPLASSEILDLVAGWLAQKENYQWLDFGNGRQIVTPTLLKIMAQRDTPFLRAYTGDRDDRPYDRLLFDLLASEHRELDEERWHRMERSHQEAVCG